MPDPPVEAAGGRLPAERQDRCPIHQDRQGERHDRRGVPQGAGAAAAAGRDHQVRAPGHNTQLCQAEASDADAQCSFRAGWHTDAASLSRS